MPRIYLPSLYLQDSLISITAEKAHYLTSVLRCRKGDVLTIFDGAGNCCKTTIVKADRREVITEVIEKFPCNPESHLNITLVQSLLKGEKMDMVIQKTTELGVKEILPVITDRSQLRDTKKIARWRKIAEEASRQSGRSMVPVVHATVEFMSFIEMVGHNRDAGTREHGEAKGLIFYEENGISLRDAINKISSSLHRFIELPVYLIVGPEGGFTKEEIALSKGEGLLVTSLGERILRAETAAISAVTLVQFLLGDMG